MMQLFAFFLVKKPERAQKSELTRAVAQDFLCSQVSVGESETDRDESLAAQ